MARKIYDHGLGGKGGLVHQKGSIVAICVECMSRRQVRRVAFSRAAGVRCTCGGKMEPSAKGREKMGLSPMEKVEERRCEKCKCKLRQGNNLSYCSPCRTSLRQT